MIARTNALPAALPLLLAVSAALAAPPLAIHVPRPTPEQEAALPAQEIPVEEIPVEELSAQTVAAAAYPLEEPASPDKPETATEDP